MNGNFQLWTATSNEYPSINEHSCDKDKPHISRFKTYWTFWCSSSQSVKQRTYPLRRACSVEMPQLTRFPQLLCVQMLPSQCLKNEGAKEGGCHWSKVWGGYPMYKWGITMALTIKYIKWYYWLVVLTIWKNISQWEKLSDILWKIKRANQTTTVWTWRFLSAWSYNNHVARQTISLEHGTSFKRFTGGSYPLDFMDSLVCLGKNTLW